VIGKEQIGSLQGSLAGLTKTPVGGGNQQLSVSKGTDQSFTDGTSSDRSFAALATES
jgi:hypothetical protein